MLQEQCNKYISQNISGVNKIIIDGNIYWLKVYGENKSNLIRKISSLSSKISYFSLFQTQAVLDSIERLEHEKKMLHYLSQRNFCVPEIDLEGPGYFVTHDRGVPLHQVDQSRVTDEVLCNLFMEFVNLHQNNIAHGRPALRDIILSPDNKLTLIDFEESIMDANSTLKARDIYILLMELCRIKNIPLERKLNVLLLWKSHVSETDWQSLLKINTLIKRLQLIPKAVLHIKKSNTLSNQLLETLALFEQLR
jgi:tRNA A-37 threonylcarbamoyl transferase component Bud32